MTAPDAPENTCITCDEERWLPNLEAEDVDDPPYVECPDCNPDGTRPHPHQVPTEAPATAAPSAWDREVAQMYDDIIDRGLHLEGGCSYDGDHPCTCYVKAHLDMVIAARVPGGAAGEALEAEVLEEVARRIYVNAVPDYEPWEAMVEEDREDWRVIARMVVEPIAAARVAASGGEALEAARAEYNESVRHDGTCGYSFDARTSCSCGKARIADALIAAARVPGGAAGEALEAARERLRKAAGMYALIELGRDSGGDVAEYLEAEVALIAAARAPGPVAPFAFPDALDASPEEQRETDAFIDGAMGPAEPGGG